MLAFEVIAFARRLRSSHVNVEARDRRANESRSLERRRRRSWMKIERLTFVPSVREIDDFDGIPLSLFKYRITFLDSDRSSKMADPLEIGANGRISRKRDKITVAR